MQVKSLSRLTLTRQKRVPVSKQHFKGFQRRPEKKQPLPQKEGDFSGCFKSNTEKSNKASQPVAFRVKETLHIREFVWVIGRGCINLGRGLLCAGFQTGFQGIPGCFSSGSSMRRKLMKWNLS